MNIHKYKNIFFISLLIFVGCKKSFLDVSATTVITRQDYIKDLKTTTEFLNGAFIELCRYLYRGDNLIYADVIADDVKPIPGKTTLLFPYNWSQTAGTNSDNEVAVNYIWTAGYQVARSACYVLECAEKFRSENSLRADTLIGQALVLRVLAHWQLLNTYSQPYKFTSDGSHLGIHYATTSNSVEPFLRESVVDIYNKMIADLKSAIPLLPNIPGNNGKLVINQNAGKALLARIYQFKSDNLNSKNMAIEVAKAVPIMNAPSYPSLLSTSQDVEALLQFPFELVNFAHNYPSVFYLFNPEFVATNDIASLLNERSDDLRRTWVKNNSSNLWNITKFPPNKVVTTRNEARSYNLTLIRSSEMYLIAAETYAKLNMEDSSKYFLDAIRKRASATAPLITATGQALLDSIYKERRKELCFENLRMFDLLRLGKGVNRSDAPIGFQQLSYPNNKAIAPIPLLEIQVSGINQNDGY